MARSICGALLLLGAVSCMSPTEPQSCGTFVGRAAGAASDSLSGCAIFTVNLETGEFGLLLTNGAPSSTNPAVKLLRAAGPPPIPETYSIVGCGAGQLCGVAFLEQRRFHLSGIVVVTQTDTLNVSGTLDAVGTDSIGVTLTIRGSFVAACKGQKRPFEQQGDPNNGTERGTPCKPSDGTG